MIWIFNNNNTAQQHASVIKTNSIERSTSPTWENKKGLRWKTLLGWWDDVWLFVSNHLISDRFDPSELSICVQTLNNKAEYRSTFSLYNWPKFVKLIHKNKTSCSLL